MFRLQTSHLETLINCVFLETSFFAQPCPYHIQISQNKAYNWSLLSPSKSCTAFSGTRNVPSALGASTLRRRNRIAFLVRGAGGS